MSTRSAAIPLLDADRGLAGAIPEAELALARRALIVKVHAVDPGPWDPAVQPEEHEPALGFLMLDGLAVREIEFGGRTTSELLGAGDLLRPWDHDDVFASLPFLVSWHVLERARLAVLDGRFLAVARSWPGVIAEIASRAVRRSRSLAFQLAIGQLTRVDDRLLVLFWQLAERWGRVGPDGVRVPLALTHRTLGRLVGARRPSVTTALTGLAREGLVVRTPEGWLIKGDPAAALARRGPLGPGTAPDRALHSA
jgi:CRP/FNR family transcriptional regulator, cyclic AMP receptor protein